MVAVLIFGELRTWLEPDEGRDSVTDSGVNVPVNSDSNSFEDAEATLYPAGIPENPEEIAREDVVEVSDEENNDYQSNDGEESMANAEATSNQNNMPEQN